MTGNQIAKCVIVACIFTAALVVRILRYRRKWAKEAQKEQP